MFKLVVLSCLVSVAFGGLVHSVPASYAVEKTIVEPHVSVVQTPTISHVGTAYKSVPSGVSHHSSSVVHSHANVVEPIYAHGVEKKYISTPVVKKVVEHVPAVAKIVAEPVYAKTVVAEPAYYAKSVVAEPAYYAKSVVAEPAYYAKSVVAAPVAYSSYSAPIIAAPKAYGYAASYPAAYSTYSVPAASYGHGW